MDNSSQISSKNKPFKEPFRIYYRVCLLAALFLAFPISLLLGLRIFNIFIKDQPAIHPKCNNAGIKIGCFLLTASKFFLSIVLLVLVGTVFLYFKGAGMSGVPLGLSLIPLVIVFPLAIIFIELSQIKFRSSLK